VQGLSTSQHPDLLIGVEHFSDAGVYRLNEHQALVQTLDFFAPLVEDPFVFGQIAAANSLSDVYAMGGQPKTALNIVGFPDGELSLDILAEILNGGSERVEAAGAVVVGGHSVRDSEIKYGISVTGIVDPKQMMTNTHARTGDVLVLTKGLGTGFITTAIRKGKCPEDTISAACASMTQLNQNASKMALACDAVAATDITGFGLAGHACEMAQAGGVCLEIELSTLPLLAGAMELAGEEHFTGGFNANRKYTLPLTDLADNAEQADSYNFLFDPQTSGGLLVAVPPQSADEFITRCHDVGETATTAIGHVVERVDADLRIRP